MRPLAYVEQGRGTPVVLLHAFPLSSAMWQAEAGWLADRARVITPDLFGFGRSPRLEPPSIAGMATGVLELLDRLTPRQPVVLGGLSMGGYVAFEVIRQAPQRVKGLALCSTRAAADTPAQRQGRLELIQRIRREGFDAAAQAKRLLGPTTLASRPAVVERVTQLIGTATPEGISDALLAMANRRDSTDLLGSIVCPTLVIAAEEDAVIPMAESIAMAAAIPGAKIARIAASGHLVNLEQPAPFRAALEPFVQLLL